MVWRPGRSRGNGKNCPVDNKTVLRLRIKKFFEMTVKTSNDRHVNRLLTALAVTVYLYGIAAVLRAMEWIFR